MRPTDIETLNPVISFAKDIHSGVPYGQSNMFDQVRRVAEIVYEATGDLDATKAAYLHKALEGKRINGGKPVPYETVAEIGGDAAAQAVRELQAYDDRTDEGTSAEKVAGAKELGKIAKVILMAEKIANFETSIERPNPKKPYTWHVAYFQSRIGVARAAADAHAGLAAKVEETYGKGIDLLSKRLDKKLGDMGVSRTATPSPG